MACATMRPTMSVVPPATKGTTTVTGLVGHSCALAKPGNASAAAKNATRLMRIKPPMNLLPIEIGL